MANEMSDLIQQRRDLSCACDSDGAFPGSRRWLAANLAVKALTAFDLERPEVLAHIRAEHDAEMASRYQD